MTGEYRFHFIDADIVWQYKKFTPLSDSAIFATWGDSAVNVSILRGEGDTEADFFPLQVEYLEHLYAAGLVAASPYVKREGHPSDAAILKARIIDRAIRPRFLKGLVDTVQVYVSVLSYDETHDPLILGFNTVVAALMSSSIPFEGPLSGVRISLNEDGSLFLNPKSISLWDNDGINMTQREKMNLFLALEPKGIVMFDAAMDEVDEQKVKDAMVFATRESEGIFKAQQEFASKYGVEKVQGTVISVPDVLYTQIKEKYQDKINEALNLTDKEEQVKALEEIEESIKADYEESEEYSANVVNATITKLMKKLVKHSVLVDGKRIGNRDWDEIRPLTIEVGLLPRAHGSGMFKRGDTQVLSIATLASLQKQLQVEEMTGNEERRYIHEYYSPPYAFGRVGRIRYYPGRREVGHGALAEKALLPVLPSKEEFPYMIRVVSEVMSSAGSTSQASVCGSSLALMDAGVPIKRPVAGISIGIIATDDFSNYRLLTDIQELEDFYGEMDFKVAGTDKGITAIQMDQKRSVIPIKIFNEALDKAKVARLFILKKMQEVIDGPRPKISKYAPAVETVQIDPTDIGRLIGPGGKIIKNITAETGVELSIEEDGKVLMFAKDGESMQKAKDMILKALDMSSFGSVEPKKEYKLGEVYDAEVVELKDFGALVKLLDGTGTVGLVHISEIADMYIKDIRKVLKIGQKVRVKVIEIDDQGRLRLSIKQA